MTNVLILGAHGKIAQLARKQLLQVPNINLSLYLRRANRLTLIAPQREKIIEGDVTDTKTLQAALVGIDVVYANLAGENIVEQAQCLVQAMKIKNVKRLIWVSTLGIYDEVPGQFGIWNHQMLDPSGYLTRYAKAAQVIEDSNLEYTIIRPAWLSDVDEIDYETTDRQATFKGTEVSRKSVAALITKLIQSPQEGLYASLGVNKPNSAGDKPSWY